MGERDLELWVETSHFPCPNQANWKRETTAPKRNGFIFLFHAEYAE
jgi:hypothetical protein